MTTLVDCLRKKGHDVCVLASETSLAESPDYRKPDYVTFYSAYAMKEKTVIKRFLNNWTEMQNSSKEARRLEKFDVVICTSPPLMLVLSAMRAAKASGAAIVFDVRDVWPDVAYEMGSFTKDSIYGKIFARISKKAYDRADLITTVTPGKVSKIKSKLSDSDARKVALVSNGLDISFLEQEEQADLISKYRLDEDPPCVYIGNIGMAQGLSSLLTIAERVESSRFLLFGNGAEKEIIATEVEKRGLSNVTVCGRISPQGAYTILRHAACAYVPLKNSSMKDSIPTKLYEALGCGCPVLLAAQGDSVDVLSETKLGAVASPENKKELFDAFEWVIKKEWTSKEREKAALTIQKKYSRQAAAETFEALLVERFEGRFFELKTEASPCCVYSKNRMERDD
ncbi:glycosyltransferase family 4 protein [Eggerthella sp. YY7918]|uniref:glycosyltransferase family 4 protein n=1 Tax=Eggerthella sp. (strain YY7918) TaxID=502558 RepID=UPI001E2A39FC|nr:glycosyltransferase family 4 protein [Eggerthella sp. YY7918]